MRIALLALLGLLCWAPASGIEPPPPADEIEVTLEFIQRALKFLGHYAGPLDGLPGPKTNVAIRSWQESAGFEASEELTRDQQQSLIRESAAGGLAEALELLVTLAPPSSAGPESPPPTESEKIDALGTALEGFDLRLNTADDGIDANRQGLSDLGTRLDSELQRMNAAALRIDSLASELKGLGERLKTADDGIGANRQVISDLGTRLDSELQRIDATALRIDALSAQLKQNGALLQDHKSRIEDNSITLYENLIRIEAAHKQLELMRRAYDQLRSGPADTDAPGSAGDTINQPIGLLLPLVLCLLVPLALVINQGGFRSKATGGTIGDPPVASVLVAWFAGGFGYFLIGIGIMYGPSLGGIIGDPSHFLGTVLLSTPADLPPELLRRLVPHLILASIVAIVACSSAPRDLTNRGHFLVAVVTGGLVYPLFGHWIATPTDIAEQRGWLAGPGFSCPAATTNVALLGGILALSLASGLGLFRARSISDAKSPRRAVPAVMSTTSAILLWIAWIGVIIIGSSDCLPQSVLLLGLAGAAGGAAVGTLLVDGVTSRNSLWQNRIPFAVLAGVVVAPIGAQEATFFYLALIGALTGVSASLLMRFLDNRSMADNRLASALLVGGILGSLGPALFGPTGFLFLRSIDVLTPQLKGIGVALLLGLVVGRGLALPIGSTRSLRTKA